MKKCSKCKEVKPMKEFYHTIAATQSYCIKCCAKDRKERNKNPDDWMYLLCGEGGWMSSYFT